MRQRSRYLLFACLISLVASVVASGALGAPPVERGAPEPASARVTHSTSPPVQAAALTPDLLAGLRLRNIGPAVMSGRFVDIEVVESDPYEFFVASSTGGIFRTTNNGVTFTPVFEREATHSIGDIALFQPDPNIIWV